MTTIDTIPDFLNIRRITPAPSPDCPSFKTILRWISDNQGAPVSREWARAVLRRYQAGWLNKIASENMVHVWFGNAAVGLAGSVSEAIFKRKWQPSPAAWAEMVDWV